MPHSTRGPYTTVRISTKTGPLAQIWLAANMSNLPRNSILQTSIVESADEIAKVSGCETDNGNSGELEHITLHTSGDLLQGIVRVYSKQTVFLLNDIKDTLTKISSLFKANQRINVTLSKTNTIARVDQLVLEDAVTEREVLVPPDLNFLFEPVSKERNRLMGTENSMERKVQGAAPWDTSLEVGRRFNPDEELEYHQSSALDLNFDLDIGNTITSSKTWEEGTRQTSLQNSRNDSSNREFNEPENFIAQDDFPLEDPNSGEWDLGVSEKNEARKEQDNESVSDISVEIGRRVAGNSNNATVDFGFELDIDKEPLDQQSDSESNDIEQNASTTGPGMAYLAKRSKVAKNSTLIDVTKIEMDNETELNDEEFKRFTMTAQDSGTNSTSSKNPRVTKKRLLEDFKNCSDGFPTIALCNFLSHQPVKRIKTLQDELIEDPVLDISLGINDDLLQSSIANSSQIGDDSEDSDHFIPIDADIGQPPIDEGSDSYVKAVEDTEEGHHSTHYQTTQTQKIRLNTGELASKSTVYMAELLRTEFIDNNSITFHNVLVAKHEAQEVSGDFVAGISRREASKGFFEMLSLATAGCIDLDQQMAFEDITIKTRAPLYEKFISA